MDSQNNNSLPTHDLPSEGSPESPPPVLDLCTRKRPITPDYTLTYPSPKTSPVYDGTPCSTYYCRSPKSISECSETSESSSLIDVDTSPRTRTRQKVTRPFKAFPKNPIALSLGIAPKPDHILVTETMREYSEFREKMLAQVQQCYSSVNKNMRRNQNESKKSADPSYLERRRRNNEAAKRSRDARKAKEDEIAIRCAFLEQENMKLRFRIAAVEKEIKERKKTIQKLLY